MEAIPESPATVLLMGTRNVSDDPCGPSMEPSPVDDDGSEVEAALAFWAFTVALWAPSRPVQKMGSLVPLLKP